MKPLRYAIPFLSTLLVGTSGLAEEIPRLPEEAIKLQNAYNRSIEATSKPIRERYVADLIKLQQRSTRAAKLDDALALKTEIESVTVRAILGKWKEAAGIMTIDADGTVRHSNGNSARWEIQDGDIVLSWKNGFKHLFPSLTTGDTVRGKLVNPQGKSDAWSATRIY